MKNVNLLLQLPLQTPEEAPLLRIRMYRGLYSTCGHFGQLCSCSI